MDANNMLPERIAAALERGALIVTGNQRAARTLRRDFDRSKKAEGLKNWQPAKIMAWSAWLSGWWSRIVIEGHSEKILLNTSQELAIWRTVLASDKEVRSLQTEALTELAAEAWTLLCSYNGQSRAGTLGGTANTRAFRRWAQNFARRCETKQYLPQAELEEAIRKVVERGEFELEAREVVLTGFDLLTPAQERLAQAMRNAGIAIEEVEIEIEDANLQLIEAADEEKELRSCAYWVRKLLEEDPNARVAVVVPKLEENKAEIDRVFREVLSPELEDMSAGSANVPYEFSIGVQLAVTPMVATALDVLRWVKGELPFERVSTLLLSPYFGGDKDSLEERAVFDAFVLRQKRMLRPEVSLEALTELVARQPELRKLASVLRNMRQTVAMQFAKGQLRTYGQWAEAMRQLLQSAAWGNDAGEDSAEFQIRAKWEEALDELATLDFDSAKVIFGEALEAMEQIAQRTMFAVESREAPVQVMGPLEAAGSRFDALWLMGTGETTWPREIAANPLLPWHIQRELQMPGVDEEKKLAIATQVTRRIARSAPTVRFSYAVQAGKTKQRVSSVLSELALEPVKATEILSTIESRVPVQLEIIEDAARLAPLPAGTVHGGVAVLEMQAACGFRAFAEKRLFATEIEQMDAGFDARENGTVVHKVLEEFWIRVKTQTELRRMAKEERDTVLRESIETALSRTEKEVRTRWDAAYLDTQKKRLASLLAPWLEIEMGRPPFRVELNEREFNNVQIGPLRLNVRVDRVDVLENEGKVILDYKTGNAEPKEWLTERPDSPQLPMYAVMTEGELEGVAFAQIRAGKDLGIYGFQAAKGVLPKWAKSQTSSLKEHVADWKNVLTQLAEDFSNGSATVSPKEYPTTCRYCAQRLLCRLDISRVEVTEELLEDEEEGYDFG